MERQDGNTIGAVSTPYETQYTPMGGAWQLAAKIYQVTSEKPIKKIVVYTGFHGEVTNPGAFLPLWQF